MKKLIALLLVAAMALSLFAACGPTPPATTKAPATTAGKTPETTKAPETTAAPEFAYPMDTDVELTMFRKQNALITAHGYAGFGDSPVAKTIEAKSGIKVVYVDTYADYDAEWANMQSTGNYTDMVSFNIFNYEGGPLMAVEDGLAIELNDVIDEFMPNFKAYLEANPDVDKAIKTDDGIYTFIPYVNSNTGAYSYGAYYREDMLKEMGETEPTTLQGWHDLLVKVKDKYGITPISCDWNGLIQYGMMAMAFGVGGNSTSNHFAVTDGKVYYQRTSDEWKAFLTEMAKWMAEGLIDANVAQIQSPDVNAKIINSEVFLSMGWLGSAMQVNQQKGAAQTEGFMLKALPTPGLTEGQKIEWGYATTLVSGVGTTISESCENVEEAARYLDYLFSPEGHIVANFGIEGESFDMVNGEPVFQDHVVKSGKLPEGLSQSQSAARYSAATTGLMAMVKHEGYYPQLMDEANCAEAIYIWRDAAIGGGHMHELPGLAYDDEEAGAIGTIITNLKTASDEYAMDIILGRKTVEESWDEYVKTIEGMGLAAGLIIMNDAYGRYLER